MPSTRRLLALAFAAGCTIAAAPASAAKRGFIVTDFDSLVLEAPIGVEVTTGRGPSASGEGDAVLLDRVDLVQTGRRLVVRLRPDGAARPERTGAMPTVVRLTTGALALAQLSGAGSLRISRPNPRRVQLVIGGSGLLHVDGIAADQVQVLMQGAGTLRLAGTVDKLSLAISGGGLVQAEGLSAGQLDLKADGSPSIALRARRAATVNASGQGSIVIAGRPACTVRQTGSASVMCGDAAAP